MKMFRLLINLNQKIVEEWPVMWARFEIVLYPLSAERSAISFSGWELTIVGWDCAPLITFSLHNTQIKSYTSYVTKPV